MIPLLSDFRKKAGDLQVSLSRDRVFFGILTILLAILAFFLGRLSKIFDERPVFSLEEMVQQKSGVASLKQFQNTSTSTIVASKKGKKYYFVWCKYADTIKESNKIYFKDEDSAKASGRTLANGCQ
jgi:hypothetical protein